MLAEINKILSVYVVFDNRVVTLWLPLVDVEHSTILSSGIFHFELLCYFLEEIVSWAPCDVLMDRDTGSF